MQTKVAPPRCLFPLAKNQTAQPQKLCKGGTCILPLQNFCALCHKKRARGTNRGTPPNTENAPKHKTASLSHAVGTTPTKRRKTRTTQEKPLHTTHRGFPNQKDVKYGSHHISRTTHWDLQCCQMPKQNYKFQSSRTSVALSIAQSR